MTLVSVVEDPIVAILGCGKVSTSAFLQLPRHRSMAINPSNLTSPITYAGKLGQAFLLGLLQLAAGHLELVKLRELRGTVRSAQTA